MNNPILLLASMLASIYAIIFLHQSHRHAQLASPHALYAGLALLHFFIPGILVGMGIAPDFVNHRNGYYVLDSFVFAFSGLMAFQLGSLSICRGLLLRPIQPRMNPCNKKKEWQVSRLLFVAFFLFSAGWLSRFHIILNDAYFQIDRGSQGAMEGPFYAAIRMVELFPLYMICMLSIKFWANPKNPSSGLYKLLMFSIASEVLYWLPSGRKECVILAVILPLIIRYLMTNKIPSVRAILLFTLFLGLFFPLSFLYRRELEIGSNYQTITEVARSSYLAFIGNGENEKSAIEILFGRLSLLEPLCACIRIWDQGIWEPMWGSSYLSALLGLIPRFLWPDKPDLHYGNEFGYVSNFISNGDFKTSISVTFFGEAYLNFGFAGLFPLFLMGLLFGLLYRHILTSRRYETSLLLYLISLPTLLYVGGTFGLYFGGLIKLIPFYYVIGRNLEKRTTQRISPVPCSCLMKNS